MTSKNRLAGLAALAGAALLVAACSNAGSGATTGATGVPATQASTVAPATEAPGSAAPSAAAMTDTINVATDSSGGQFIVATNGMPLYLFTPDGDDMSTCKDTCAANWPAYTVADGVTPTAGAGVTGTVGTFKRDDGTMQVTINKQPLYFFANDKAPGDTNGQGLNEVWYLVQPSGTQVAGGKGTY
jgi:predicted lipoprotein with Yx(FWY)xxD motif